MEQEPSNIDKYFKDKLEGFEKEPLPSSWRKIEKQLDYKKLPKSKKANRFYFIAIAASVVIWLGVSYIFWQPSLITPSANENKTPTAFSTQQREDNKKRLTEKEATKQDKMPLPKTKEEIGSSLASSDVATLESKQEYILPDGSKVYLNRNSKITYFSDFKENRRVVIKEGEAFFEIKHLHNQPFVVESNYSRTEVLGTSFMIKSDINRNLDEIFVETGKVSFSLTGLDEFVYLVGGEHASTAIDHINHGTITDENYAAWKKEEIVFNNTSLSEVVKTLEKYYGVTLQVNNPEIVNCRFTGRFEKSSLDEVLQVLAATFNLSFDGKERIFILSGKGCK